jgi:lipoic acid synthetase
MRRERLNEIQPLSTHDRPEWLKVKVSMGDSIFNDTKQQVRDNKLHTVCEEAACPNIGECWKKKHATVMILGNICTRSCRFCNVQTGKPGAVDENEPASVGNLAKNMALKHMVITSVDRDDLPDGGANHFVNCIAEVRKQSPNTTVEVLTPDFRHKENALEQVISALPDVFNHNLETVSRLYQEIRPKARYFHSLNLLWRAKQLNKNIFTKSGIMVGLGEEKKEIIQVMNDLRSANVDFLTIGQYLQPTAYHVPVSRFVTPDEFAEYKDLALKKGFSVVSSSPLTRSSYHADSDFELLRQSKKTT